MQVSTFDNYLARLIMCILFIFICLNGVCYDYVGDNNSASIKVVYSRTMVVDTINPCGNLVNEYLTLKASPELSIFYSERFWETWNAMISDTKNITNYFLDQKLHKSFVGLENNIVYRDYKNNRTIEHQRYDLTNWEFVESLERPQWNICDSICNILNYDCIMATTKFRGRHWTVFFTPEIPIQEGPWKLCGLPGIILKAHDSKGQYEYEAIELIIGNAGIVEFQPARSRIGIKDRRKGLQYRRKCLSEDISKKIQAAYGININKIKNRPKNYDFEETDYPHE